MITRCQFENCELLGPAVLLIVGGVTVENSSFDGPGTFLTVDTDREYFGMIGVRDTKFINCVFRNVGIAAGQDTINEFLADVLPRD
jgi:hypothetical protein